jgi:hypothetical protein
MEKEKSPIKTAHEIQKEVIYDKFFDKNPKVIGKTLFLRIRQTIATVLVWIVTFVPAVVTLAQIYYHMEDRKGSKPFLYLQSTIHLFADFSLSTFIALCCVIIVVVAFAIYRNYATRKSYASVALCKKYDAREDEIKEKEIALDYHFSPTLGEPEERTTKRWITIPPEENISSNEVDDVYKEYFKKE